MTYDKELDGMFKELYYLANNTTQTRLITIAKQNASALLRRVEVEAKIGEIDWVHKNTELVEMENKKPAFIIRGAKLDKRVAELRELEGEQE